MNRRDPRIRQRLDQLQSDVESVNIRVQTSLYDLFQLYINPCLQSVSDCLDNTCEPCVGSRRARTRQRHMSRSTRPEHMFDFYNDLWDEFGEEEGPTENTGLLNSWAAPDLDRLLAGGDASNGNDQPGRQVAMNYGSRGPPSAGLSQGRGRSLTSPKGGELSPNEVPSSSMFGFLESLPWKIGRRGLRYKPSAATLQENPHRKPSHDSLQPVTEGDTDIEADTPRTRHHRRGLSAAIAGRGGGESGGAQSGTSTRPPPHRGWSEQSLITPPPTRSNRKSRQRSGTTASQATHTSLSSRGDLFPSDDEDDAVPLDDEFAHMLERRTTGSGSGSGGRRRSSLADGDLTSNSNSRSGSGSVLLSARSRQSLAALTSKRDMRSDTVESADEDVLEMNPRRKVPRSVPAENADVKDAGREHNVQRDHSTDEAVASNRNNNGDLTTKRDFSTHHEVNEQGMPD